jgi:hypothetical protein
VGASKFSEKAKEPSARLSQLALAICLVRARPPGTAQGRKQRGPGSPLTVGDLRPGGLTDADLRSLVGKGLLQVLLKAKPAERRPSARGARGVNFTRHTRFRLTAAGEDFTTWARDAWKPGKPLVPRWVAADRELRVCGILVKRFRVPAENQELVFATCSFTGLAAWYPLS